MANLSLTLLARYNSDGTSGGEDMISFSGQHLLALEGSDPDLTRR